MLARTSPALTALVALLGLEGTACYRGPDRIESPASDPPAMSAPPAPAAPPAPPPSPPGVIGVFGPEAPAPLSPRVIPLRIVVLVHCDRCAKCRRSCRPGPTRERFETSLRAANEVFAPAGVRFEIGSIERVESEEWWLFEAPPVKRRWGEIRGEAKRVFPWVPDNAWSDAAVEKQSNHWLEVLTAAFSRPREITVYVQAGYTKAGTAFPDEGRGLWSSDGTFGTPRKAMPYLFAHELGHYLGLMHTFGHAGTSPITGRMWRIAERWDLIYRPGSSSQDPHRFFRSREEALAQRDSDLRLIERSEGFGSNCVEQRDGALECVLEGKDGYVETHRSGEDALGGLSMPLGPGESGRFRWARNVVDYGDMEIPRRLSASQIEMIRVYLQRPIRLGDAARTRWSGYPDGFPELPSYRTTLGLPAR